MEKHNVGLNKAFHNTYHQLSELTYINIKINRGKSETSIDTVLWQHYLIIVFMQKFIIFLCYISVIANLRRKCHRKKVS